MNCQQFIGKLDEYLDRELAHPELEAAAAHADGCAGCRQTLARRQSLRTALRELPTATPRPGFFDEAMQHAYRTHAQSRRVYFIGAALAASLALWIGFGLFPNPLQSTEKLTSVTIALAEPRTIQLAFNADHELPQAMVDIQLPDGVEVQGYPGQRRIRWQTDLARGVNVLSLPLIAVSPSGGLMLARLEHGDRSTELTVQLRVNDRSRSSLPEVSNARA